MPKSNIIKALEELDKKDIYSLILFTLYRLKEIPEYSTLSELVYVLDNENFIKFLNYFGGQTIRVPTVQELSDVLDALIVYEQQQHSDNSLPEIMSEIGLDNKNRDAVVRCLRVISELMEKYDFKRNA